MVKFQILNSEFSISRRALSTLLAVLWAPPVVAQTRDDLLAAMKRATTFMVDKVAHRGGYVWNYLPNLSRRWGEMEARETMIWIQPPGTATMGHLYLDTYHATGDSHPYKGDGSTTVAPGSRKPTSATRATPLPIPTTR